ncbi:MAG: hypothetical protein IJT32_06875, partial [Lachnospiraceae bacterium]|nr:hypothetical protein [Lachnospiraceae bacterium]
FLVRRTPSGTLIPALLFAYGPEFQKNLGYMIRYSIMQALKSYPPKTVVMIPRITAAAKALTDKLLPNETGTEIFYGRRKEDN